MHIRIADLEREIPSGCVTTVHVIFDKVDGEYTASRYGSVGIPHKDCKDPTFIPFEELTQDQVAQWALDAIGVDQIAEIESGINSEIEMKKNPTHANGLPWVE
jgi:hypothetical protein